MRTVCGISLNKFGICIGSLYFLQSINGSISLILNLVYRANNGGELSDEGKELVLVICITLVLCLTFVLTSPLLIWGSVKKKHLFLIPWLYNSLVSIISDGLYFIAMLRKFFVNQQNSDIKTEVGAFELIVIVLVIAFQIAHYQIIRMLYKELIFEQQLRNMEASSTMYVAFDETAKQG